MHRTLHCRQTVLRHNDHFSTNIIGSGDDLSDALINLSDSPGILNRQPLIVVIQMRQVSQRQLRLLLAHHGCSGIGNPLRTRQTCVGPPETKKRKRTVSLDKVTTGLVQNIKHLRTITTIVWFGRDAISTARRLIEPPEHFGRFDPIVKLVRLNQRIGLLPKPNLLRVFKIPTVTNNPMFARRLPRQQSCLRRTSHRRNRRLPRHDRSHG